MDGKQVEVPNVENGIIIAYNSDSDNDEIPRNVSLSSISCIVPNIRDDDVSQEGNVQKNKTQVTTKYIPSHLKNTNEIKVPKNESEKITISSTIKAKN